MISFMETLRIDHVPRFTYFALMVCIYLLTFNEPNFSDQSNMSPQQAADAWPQVEAVATKYPTHILNIYRC